MRENWTNGGQKEVTDLSTSDLKAMSPRNRKKIQQRPGTQPESYIRLFS